MPQVNAVPQQGHSVPPVMPARRLRPAVGDRSRLRRRTGRGYPSAVDAARARSDDPKLSAALRTLELTVKRKLDGVLHGDHLGLIPGPGSEPGESRVYQPGDDVRRMDWSVTARTTITARPADDRRPRTGDLAGGRHVGQPGLRHHRSARSVTWRWPPRRPSRSSTAAAETGSAR